MNAFCDMSLDRQFFLAAVIFYAITALWGVRFWKNGFRGNLFPWAIWPISALILHSKAMLLRGFSIESCPIHNLFEAGMFISKKFLINKGVLARKAIIFIVNNSFRKLWDLDINLEKMIR